MARLVECVPNFSEGRRPEVVEALAQVVRSQSGVRLLDQTADADHNRSVLTFAGPADAVTAAMETAFAKAVALIDMNSHTGQHPRIGAVDVIPFVPIGETTMDECVDLARAFGRQAAEQFGIPVYMYAKAALRPAREVLASIRRPQFEGLRDLIVTPDYKPDYGPALIHPTAGAVAVGARPFLIAYNMNLDTADVEIAKRIARGIRESSGGLPRVQALGLYLEDLDCAQVSMNLLDFSVTPIWQVWQEVEDAARAEGVGLRESELIGLCPVAALTEVAEHIRAAESESVEARITEAARWLRIRDFDPSMALELRLAAAEAAGAADGKGANLG